MFNRCTGFFNFSGLSHENIYAMKISRSTVPIIFVNRLHSKCTLDSYMTFIVLSLLR